MDGAFYVLLRSRILFRDNVFVMDCVMCELCHAFHVGTMYYVSLCAMNYM
jgi:hypothetical protein